MWVAVVLRGLPRGPHVLGVVLRPAKTKENIAGEAEGARLDGGGGACGVGGCAHHACPGAVSNNVSVFVGLGEYSASLGLGGFHPVPGTWIVREDLSLVQFELYRGEGGESPPPDS